MESGAASCCSDRERNHQSPTAGGDLEEKLQFGESKVDNQRDSSIWKRYVMAGMSCGY